MKILHIYKDYYPVVGGIENHLRQLAEAQARRGHAVTVLATAPDWRSRVEPLGGVRVIFAGRLATLASTPLSLALPWQLLRQRPDITHLHFPYPVGDLAQALCGRGRRTVITYHSDIVRQKGLLRGYAPLLRRTLARADGIIATSPRYVETSPFMEPVAKRCTVIPYGIETERYEARREAEAAAIRAQYGEQLVLFVGQLSYYKGVEYLIQAMPQVNGRALLAGGESTWRQNELEGLARRLGVADRVIFLGQQEQALPALYQACNVFVLPSIERSEAFGIVQLEAMASGRPVVSCDVGTGVAWVNQDGITGLVVPPRDPGRLATALNRLLDDPPLAARLGQAGQARVREQFTQARMVEQIEQLYEQVLEPGLTGLKDR